LRDKILAILLKITRYELRFTFHKSPHMSGIVGIFHLGGKPVDHGELDTMLAAIAHRGPDGKESWREGGVGLGCCLLRITPESFHEKLPLKNTAGNLVITADARLDNRDELIAQLGLSSNAVREITDSWLILCAYEKWGEACPQKLLGDFAFAIWDKPRRRLFCGRDHLGCKPLFYFYLPNRLFAFASEIKALLCLPQVSREINEEKVGIYLCQLSGYAERDDRTFFKRINRLLSSHSLRVSENGLQTRSYHEWDTPSFPELKSEDDFVEAFRERFEQAVACRMRSAYPIASTLSGGLDSSAVSCVARNLLNGQNPNGGNGVQNFSFAGGSGNAKALHSEHRLLTIYTDCGVASTDEKKYVEAVLRQGGCEHDDVAVGGPISAAQVVTPWLDQPVCMPTPALLLTMTQAAQQRNARVLLTGHDGDTIVSHGYDYFTELAATQQWNIIKNIVTAQINSNGANGKLTLQKQIERRVYPHVLKNLQAQLKKRWLKTYTGALSQASQAFSFSAYTQLSLLVRSAYVFRPARWQSYNPAIHPEFARRIQLSQLLQQEYDHQSVYLPSEYLYHRRMIASDNLQLMSEQIDHVSAVHGVEARHPFLDKRLVELCLAAPVALKYDGGRGRGTLRRAMKNILPDEIFNRRNKIDFSAFITHGMANGDRQTLEHLLFEPPDGQLAEFVDRKHLHRMYRQFLQCESAGWKNRRKGRLLSKIAYLAVWLNKVYN
jgi:asparagine synthase (glutamine-hydrolysing)